MGYAALQSRPLRITTRYALPGMELENDRNDRVVRRKKDGEEEA